MYTECELRNLAADKITIKYVLKEMGRDYGIYHVAQHSAQCKTFFEKRHVVANLVVGNF
jgi:hypothetical protein